MCLEKITRRSGFEGCFDGRKEIGEEGEEVSSSWQERIRVEKGHGNIGIINNVQTVIKP